MCFMSGSQRQGASSITCPLAGWLKSSSLIVDMCWFDEGPWPLMGGRERWKTCPTHFQKTAKLTGLSQNCFQMDATAVILGSFTWDVWKDISLGLLAAPRTANHRPSGFLSVWMEEGPDGDCSHLKLQSWEGSLRLVPGCLQTDLTHLTPIVFPSDDEQ